jgi:hypothetical protein
VYSKKPVINAAFHLAKQTTMSNLFEYLRHQRSGPVLMEHLRIFPDAVSQAYRFQLGDFFQMDIDHEYLLEVTPMLYKAHISMLRIKTVNNVQANAIINQAPADLIEFPPLILKLLTNGSVVPLESLPPIKKP